MAPPIFLFVEVTHIATTRIIPMHHNKGKTIAQCLHDRTAYAMNPEKTDGGELVSAFQCNPGIVESEFLFSKRQYQAFTGRKQKNDVLAYQVRQSFKPAEITPEEANRVGYEFAMRFLKGKHAFIVATHIDKKHIHNHIIWNSTALDCQKKFRDFHRSGMAVRQLSDIICLEHGLSIIEKPNRHGKSYNVWQGERKKLSNRDRLRYAIDDALAAKPKSFDAMLRILQKAGYDLMTQDELAVMDGGKCILQLRGVRPFFSDKFDITKHPNYKYTSDFDPRNAFDIEMYLSTKLRPKADEAYESYDVGTVDEIELIVI